MKSRLFLAALHYNENSGREQQKDKQGKLQYAIAFPKYKKGGHMVQTILVDCTYNVDQLFVDLINTMQNVERENQGLAQATTPPLCSNYVKPDKATAVAQHTARFV